MDKDFNPTITEEGFGALAIAACVVCSPLLRPWYSRWGTTEAETRMPLPGDDRVSNPKMQNTRAITINTPAEKVWLWLVQMGQGRGGLYSYARLENLVGCDMHNANRIIPAYQSLAVGDQIRLAPEGGPPPFDVVAVEPGRAIVLYGSAPPTTWSFILAPIDAGTTRLLIRFRQNYGPGLGNTILWRAFTDPINFVMERKMLLGIKERAEKSAYGSTTPVR
jgi:hypothetical protein